MNAKNISRTKITHASRKEINKGYIPHNLCNELNNHQNLTFEDPHYNSLNALSVFLPLFLSLSVNAEHS